MGSILGPRWRRKVWSVGAPTPWKQRKVFGVAVILASTSYNFPGSFTWSNQANTKLIPSSDQAPTPSDQAHTKLRPSSDPAPTRYTQGPARSRNPPGHEMPPEPRPVTKSQGRPGWARGSARAPDGQDGHEIPTEHRPVTKSPQSTARSRNTPEPRPVTKYRAGPGGLDGRGEARGLRMARMVTKSPRAPPGHEEHRPVTKSPQSTARSRNPPEHRPVTKSPRRPPDQRGWSRTFHPRRAGRHRSAGGVGGARRTRSTYGDQGGPHHGRRFFFARKSRSAGGLGWLAGLGGRAAGVKMTGPSSRGRSRRGNSASEAVEGGGCEESGVAWLNNMTHIKIRGGEGSEVRAGWVAEALGAPPFPELAERVMG
eukprot:scaffold11260_cov105-Isochrysis_galbana.AAC.5